MRRDGIQNITYHTLPTYIHNYMMRIVDDFTENTIQPFEHVSIYKADGYSRTVRKTLFDQFDQFADFAQDDERDFIHSLQSG